jgi:hypothetical protein
MRMLFCFIEITLFCVYVSNRRRWRRASGLATPESTAKIEKKRNLAHVKSLGIACRVICYRVVILIIDYACAGSAEIGWRSDQITAAAADFCNMISIDSSYDTRGEKIL